MKYTVEFRLKDKDKKNAVEKPQKCLFENDQSKPTGRSREEDVLISEELINDENDEVQTNSINNVVDEHEESNVNTHAYLEQDSEADPTTKSIQVSDQNYSYNLLERTGVNIETLNELATCSFP